MALARGEPLQSEPILLVEAVVAARADLAAGAATWHDALEPHDVRVRAHAGLLARLLHVLYENAILASRPARTDNRHRRAHRSGARRHRSRR